MDDAPARVRDAGCGNKASAEHRSAKAKLHIDRCAPVVIVEDGHGCCPHRRVDHREENRAMHSAVWVQKGGRAVDSRARGALSGRLCDHSQELG
jgi:hypothetical protein